MNRDWAFASTIVLLSIVGCSEKSPDPTAPAKQEAPPPPPATTPTKPAFDETKGYLHRPSGVGFVYPRGWDNLGVSDKGPFTSLGLRRREPPVDVTLYWTKPEEPTDDKTVGDIEYKAMKALYGDEKVGKLEPVTINDKPGFRMTLTGVAPGATGTDLKGVLFVFAVLNGGQWWKVKLRASSRDDRALKAAEGLVKNYQW